MLKLLFISLIWSSNAFADEPVCTSRYDFDYKLLNEIVEIKENLRKGELKITQLQTITESLLNKGSGSTFTRWGRTVCGEYAELVYTGYTAGKKYNEKGSGGNRLCLPTDPSWLNFTDGNDHPRGHVFGSEIDVNEPSQVFPKHVNEQDIPCAVCRSDKATTLMIPGRNTCYPGWRLEYEGYIMSNYHDHPSPIEYICLDADPEFIIRGERNDNENILYLVEVSCGSLPCPPYVQGRELACVVCSK